MAIRTEFLRDENLARAYAFCLDCTGRGNLPAPKFREMLGRADRLGIWAYVGIEVWCVAHVLLLLADFGTERGPGFHFALGRCSKLSDVWDAAHAPVGLLKLFSDTSKPMTRIGGGPNPLPIRRIDFDRIDPGWVGRPLLNALRP